MTFEDIRSWHEAGEQLAFTHPDLKGTMFFNEVGELGFINDGGETCCAPLWLSDFDRDDWILVHTATD